MMNVLVSVLLLVIGVIVLSYYFFFREPVDKWIIRNKKKVIGGVAAVSIASAGIMLVPVGDQPQYPEITNEYYDSGNFLVYFTNPLNSTINVNKSNFCSCNIAFFDDHIIVNSFDNTTMYFRFCIGDYYWDYGDVPADVPSVGHWVSPSWSQNITNAVMWNNHTVSTGVDFDNITWVNVQKAGLMLDRNNLAGFNREHRHLLFYKKGYENVAPVHSFVRLGGKVSGNWHTGWITSNANTINPYYKEYNISYTKGGHNETGTEKELGYYTNVSIAGQDVPVQLGMRGNPFGQDWKIPINISVPVNLDDIAVEYVFALNPSLTNLSKKVHHVSVLKNDSGNWSMYNYTLDEVVELGHGFLSNTTEEVFFMTRDNKTISFVDFSYEYEHCTNAIWKVEQINLPRYGNVWVLRLTFTFGSINSGEHLYLNAGYTTPSAVSSYSCQETAPSHLASHSMDDSTSTYWQEDWGTGDVDGAIYDWYITYDMGSTQTIEKIQIYSGGSQYVEYPCKVGVIKVCDDAACSGESDLLASDCTLPYTAGWHECDFTDTSGRYIQLRGGVSSYPYCNDKDSGRSSNYFYEFDAYVGTAANNAPTMDTFNIDNDDGCTAGWDGDNNDAQMDWTTTDADANPVTVYITFNKGSAARAPTTADYDYHVQDDDAVNKDCNWENHVADWADYDGAIHVKARAHDGTDYSVTTLSDTLANGIDGTAPSFSAFAEDADGDSGGDGYAPDSGYYDDNTYVGDFSGCTDATSGIANYYIKYNGGSYGAADADGANVGCTIAAGDNDIYYKIVDNAGNIVEGDTTDNVFYGTTDPSSMDMDITGNILGFGSGDPSWIADSTDITSGTLYINTGLAEQTWGITMDASGAWGSGGAWKTVFEAGWNVAEKTDTSSPYTSNSYSSTTGAEADIWVKIINKCGEVQQLTLTTTVDTTNPTAPTNVQCRPDSYVDTGEYDDDTTIYVTWTDGTDGGSGIYDHYMEYNDATPEEEASGNDQQDTDTGAEGLCTFYVRGVDKVGNWGSTDSDTITVDLTNPTGTIDTYGVENPTSIEGDSADTSSGVASNDITIHDTTDGDYWTGSAWGASTWLDCTGTTAWSYDSSGVSWDSGHEITITLRIYDSAGNVDASADTELFTTTSETIYNTTIRNTGVDYFTYLGGNLSVSTFKNNITGFDESSEYIGIWANDTWSDSNSTWQRYNGDGTGTDFTLHTFDVIQIYLTDSGTQVINMTENPNMNYTNTKSYNLVNNSVNKGNNFTGYNRIADTSLSAINTSITLQYPECLGVWNQTTYGWDFFYPEFWETTVAVYQWNVIWTRVENLEVWAT